ncbi:MAG: cyclopropane-fatty-acyl-phospholipid synthase family protein [Actinomycetota bacterium]
MDIAVSGRWPSVARTPRAPLAATVARLIFERAVRLIGVHATYPGGASIGAGSEDSPAFEIVRPRAFFARLGRDTKIGFGEAYMAGDWRAGPGTDLADLLAPFATRLTSLVPEPLQRLRTIVDKRVPPSQENTPDGSRRNIHAHYDLSNELFAAFLDPTMSYSAAWFDDSESLVTANRLEEAQLRKIDGILDFAGVTSGTRVLEIGTGWGALAIRAAQRGAVVTTVTISAEQLALASERVARAGLSERVDLRLQDYRDVEGQFDAIVSVEMLEAVGEAYWPAYFATLDRLLAPGGKVSIQAITMAHERVLATKRSFSWIQKYIFPGGIIPSLQSIDDALAAHTTLRVTERRELGAHYARTLHLWRERFCEQWPHIHRLGFDETFRRMWEFYLAYCEAGFRTGYLGVSQLKMTRQPQWS